MTELLNALIIAMSLNTNIYYEQQNISEQPHSLAETTVVAEEITVSEEENLFYDYELYSTTTTYSQMQSDYNRNYNIALASDSINGIIIEAGESFSYNDVILEKRNSNSNGKDYKMATVISNGNYIDGIGGGICQVSSTLFSSALNANMTILERQSHSQPVSYIENGLDATVVWGQIDFVFRNDLSGPVQIYSSTNDGELIVKILAMENYDIGDVNIVTTKQGNAYYTARYVNDQINYTTKSVYKI